VVTYLVLNLVFVALVVIVLRIRTIVYRRAWLFALTALLLLTVVFDNLIIGFDIVDYNPDKLLGLYIGNIPVEDFFYTVLAALLIPALWHTLESKRNDK
jgi:lycopene cyclase domain-containing protein